MIQKKSVRFRKVGTCFIKPNGPALAFAFSLVLPLAILTSIKAKAQPIRVAVISDLNGPYGSTNYRSEVNAAVSRVIALRPDVILCTGDMIASQAPVPLPAERVRSMWSAFHSEVTAPIATAGIAFAPTPGNHDASGYQRFEVDRALYQETWSTRRPLGLELVSQEHFPLRYAFRIQDSLFVSLDATTIGPMKDEQVEWLSRVLEANAWARHKIVYGHVPITPFTIGRERDTMRDERLVDLLARHEVTAYLSGHSHGYFPGNYRGLRVVSTGAVGDGPRPLIGTASPTPRSILWIELPTQSKEIVSIEAWMGPAFSQLLSRLSLPAAIEYGGIRITRDDLSSPPQSQ